jgi:hypothetical protein
MSPATVSARVNGFRSCYLMKAVGFALHEITNLQITHFYSWVMKAWLHGLGGGGGGLIPMTCVAHLCTICDGDGVFFSGQSRAGPNIGPSSPAKGPQEYFKRHPVTCKTHDCTPQKAHPFPTNPAGGPHQRATHCPTNTLLGVSSPLASKINIPKEALVLALGV